MRGQSSWTPERAAGAACIVGAMGRCNLTAAGAACIVGTMGRCNLTSKDVSARDHRGTYGPDPLQREKTRETASRRCAVQRGSLSEKLSQQEHFATLDIGGRR